MWKSKHNQETPFELRWLRPSDLEAVLQIEAQAFAFPWDNDDFVRSLRNPTTLAKVSVVFGSVAGYVVWDCRRHALRLVNIAVAPDHRHMGIGRQMVRHLQNKTRMSPPRWRCVTALVDEYNDAAIRFMQSVGFSALGIDREPFDQPGRDGIQFEWERERHGLETKNAATSWR